MFYLVKTPCWLKWAYKDRVWQMSAKDKALYLTFDDGPHPQITPFVLDELKKYDAKATFFCIGNNVKLYPKVYDRILAEGHSIGNHTHDHVNGWKMPTASYLNNVNKAKKVIHSNLFRPPYGKVTHVQVKKLTIDNGFRVIMWDVLSGDFDKTVSPEKCLRNVMRNVREGSIIVFHDSEKAYHNMYYTLPIVMEYFSKKGHVFKKIDMQEVVDDR